MYNMVSCYSPLVLLAISVSIQGPLVAVGLLVVVVWWYMTPSFIRSVMLSLVNVEGGVGDLGSGLSLLVAVLLVVQVLSESSAWNVCIRVCRPGISGGF